MSQAAFSPSTAAKTSESYSFYQLLIKDMNKQRLKRLRLDKNGFPLFPSINQLLEKHQDMPMPGRSRNEGMRFEELELA